MENLFELLRTNPLMAGSQASANAMVGALRQARGSADIRFAPAQNKGSGAALTDSSFARSHLQRQSTISNRAAMAGATAHWAM